MSAKATIAGVPLDNAGSISWAEKLGSQATTTTILMARKTAEEIFRRAIPTKGVVSLKWQHYSGPVQEYKKLHIIGFAPTNKPTMGALILADDRWRMSYRHMRRTYNTRRRSGDFRYLEGEVIKHVQAVPDQLYVPESIKNRKEPWKPGEILLKLFEELEYEVKNPKKLAEFDQLPFENFEYDGMADRLVGQVISRIAGANFYLDTEGRVVIVNAFDETEEAEVLKLGPDIDLGGTLIRQDYRFVRAPKIRIKFTREHEVRFDFRSGVQSLRNNRFMENVLPLPDLKTTYFGSTKGAGTWVRIDNTLFSAWNPTPANLPELSQSIVEVQHPWDLLTKTYGEVGNEIDPAADWRGRIAALTKHWRTTWRLNRRWANAALSIKPWRVTLLDPENSTFNKSVVFQSYTVAPSVRGMLYDKNKATYWYTITDSYNLDTALCKAAPATVRLLDAQLGIVHFDFGEHPLGHVTKYYPYEILNIPNANVGSLRNRVDGPYQLAATQNHSAAVILTLIPGYTNNDNQFHIEERSQSIFGPLVQKALGIQTDPALAPVLEVRVPANFTARFIWDDKKQADIEKVFGLDVDRGESKEDPNLSRRLSSLLVNGDEVSAIADAIASILYERWRDHILGVRTDKHNTDVHPTGNLQQVTHTLNTVGALTTRVSLSAQLAPNQWIARLPEDIRRVMLRQVQD